MKFNPHKKTLYLITSGQTNHQTKPDSPEFVSLLELIQAAITAGIDLIQIREKQLSASVLFALTEAAARLKRGSSTRLLVNDRADIAATAGADGVHLAVDSLSADVIRATFGEEFLIGVSTHTLHELSAAHAQGADFAVFGPVFRTGSKQQYGEPLGIERLRDASVQLKTFPVLALGGITLANAAECIRAGAQGISGISIFNDSGNVATVVNDLRQQIDAVT